MAAHNQLGQAGEDLAARYLEEKDYRICHRNWRAGRHELDIVAEKDQELVIVEVKSRSNDTFGEAYEAVDGKKMRSILLATDAYVKRFAIDLPVRFDIVTITGNSREHRIEHIENAFYPPLW